MFLSPTQLDIEVHDVGSNGTSVHIMTGDELFVSVCFDHLHRLLKSYSDVPLPKTSQRGQLAASESPTTLSCTIGSCILTLSSKNEFSTLVQLSARQTQLQIRFDTSTSLDFTIASLGVLEWSGPHCAQSVMLIRDRGDTGDGGPNVSMTAVLGTKSEMSIVLSRLCFAILPYRFQEILSEFKTAIPRTKSNFSGHEDARLLNFRITCNQSQFIYSPERLNTRLGLAVGLYVFAIALPLSFSMYLTHTALKGYSWPAWTMNKMNLVIYVACYRSMFKMLQLHCCQMSRRSWKNAIEVHCTSIQTKVYSTLSLCRSSFRAI
jgi:hypothetical protein